MSTSQPDVYLNGLFVPRAQAKLDIEDRGAMFADGVYEVLRYYAGKPFAMDRHVARLRRSLAALRIVDPPHVDELPAISDELVTRNHLPDATVYWQITRGVAPRYRAFPKNASPTVLAMTAPAKPLDPAATVPVQELMLLPDRRWHRCSIKSLMLLDGVLSKQEALDAGFDDAVYHRGDVVTEATAANVAIVRAGELWTHPTDDAILPGVSRAIVLELAAQLNIPVHEQPFTTRDLLAADEALLCGTTTHVTAIASVDRQSIGASAPGPVTRKLHDAFVAHIIDVCHLSSSQP